LQTEQNSAHVVWISYNKKKKKCNNLGANEKYYETANVITIMTADVFAKIRKF
jgi:hypothetical protein